VGPDVAPDVACFRDTCNVYVLRAGREATLVDFGSGAVLDHLDELGVERVTDVVVTHHHRDQVQGLARAAAAGIRIWVPPVEVDLIAHVDLHWQSRQVANDYDLRQDRFSLLEEVPVVGTVAEYRTRRYGGVELYTLPTPGHTVGSVSYLLGGVAFTGDLIYGPGKVWSLAATQWTYTGVEGQAATIVSCGLLADRRPELLLPSHGDPIEQPADALAATAHRLQELVDLRRATPWDLERFRTQPWERITPHLLRNRTSIAYSYALLSESGAALLFDWGYDMCTGWTATSDRDARRPLLASLDALRRDHAVERVEVVVPTHYHDDHVAGINLLREVEGAEAWVPEDVAPVLERPRDHDLPCLWFEPVPADLRLGNRVPVRWREYELTPYPFPGHTRYAAAICFEVDGNRVLAVGDQYVLDAGVRPIANYQYRNRFSFDDYVASGRLLLELEPDLLVGGHWSPRFVDAAERARMASDGERLAQLHRELLPLDETDFGAEGFGARIEPYRSRVAPGEAVDLAVAIRNPFAREADAAVRLVVPPGWNAEPAERSARLRANGVGVLHFRVLPNETPQRRGRVGADLTVDGIRFGQQAEALVDAG
jgi:glyoxylase-like metal-dependent hydrolase (beta-lactamase superfamily II)